MHRMISNWQLTITFVNIQFNTRSQVQLLHHNQIKDTLEAQWNELKEIDFHGY